MAKGKKLDVATLEATEEPVAPGRSLEIKVPEVDSPHVVVEVVYDTNTIAYDLGEMHQDLELKVPLAEDGGEYSVRVVSVETTDEGEKRTLIAKS